MAFHLLLLAASAENLSQGRLPQQLIKAAMDVPSKVAFIAGLGWASTVWMVHASARLGAAEAHVLVIAGEVLTAVAVDMAGGKPESCSAVVCRTLAPALLTLLGVVSNLLDEFGSGDTGNLHSFLVTALGAFVCGICLVLNSWGNSHLRQYLGALNSSTWSALIGSLGNAAIWTVAQSNHWVDPFRPDGRASTWVLWVAVGLTSSWMITVMTFVPGRIGFARTFCLIVAGKVSGGLLADALGMVGKPRAISAIRMFGAAAVLLGAFLQKAGHEEQPAAETSQLVEDDESETEETSSEDSSSEASKTA